MIYIMCQGIANSAHGYVERVSKTCKNIIQLSPKECCEHSEGIELSVSWCHGHMRNEWRQRYRSERNGVLMIRAELIEQSMVMRQYPSSGRLKIRGHLRCCLYIAGSQLRRTSTRTCLRRSCLNRVALSTTPLPSSQNPSTTLAPRE